MTSSSTFSAAKVEVKPAKIDDKDKKAKKGAKEEDAAPPPPVHAFKIIEAQDGTFSVFAADDTLESGPWGNHGDALAALGRVIAPNNRTWFYDAEGKEVK